LIGAVERWLSRLSSVCARRLVADFAPSTRLAGVSGVAVSVTWLAGVGGGVAPAPAASTASATPTATTTASFARRRKVSFRRVQPQADSRATIVTSRVRLHRCALDAFSQVRRRDLRPTSARSPMRSPRRPRCASRTVRFQAGSARTPRFWGMPCETPAPVLREENSAAGKSGEHRALFAK
jgi:hypothetical protein